MRRTPPQKPAANTEPDVAAFLMPLARLNINAHLEKLRDEGRLEATADGT